MSTRNVKPNHVKTLAEWDTWFEQFKESINQRQIQALDESSELQKAIRTLDFRKAEVLAYKVVFAASAPAESARRSRLMDQIFDGIKSSRRKR